MAAVSFRWPPLPSPQCNKQGIFKLCLPWATFAGVWAEPHSGNINSFPFREWHILLVSSQTELVFLTIKVKRVSFYLLMKNLLLKTPCIIKIQIFFYPVLEIYSYFPVFLIYLLIMLWQLSHFPRFTHLQPAHPLPPTFPAYSSCPWVIL